MNQTNPKYKWRSTMLALLTALSLLIAPLAPLASVPLAPAHSAMDAPTSLADLFVRAKERSGFENLTALVADLYNDLFAAQPAATKTSDPPAVNETSWLKPFDFASLHQENARFKTTNNALAVNATSWLKPFDLTFLNRERTRLNLAHNAPAVQKTNWLRPFNLASRNYGLVSASALVCSNGTVETGETCDDGNSANNDGCSSLCLIEDGYFCGPAGLGEGPSVCVTNPSGNIVFTLSDAGAQTILSTTGGTINLGTRTGAATLGSTVTFDQGSLTIDSFQLIKIGAGNGDHIAQYFRLPNPASITAGSWKSAFQSTNPRIDFLNAGLPFGSEGKGWSLVVADGVGWHIEFYGPNPNPSTWTIGSFSTTLDIPFSNFTPSGYVSYSTSAGSNNTITFVTSAQVPMCGNGTVETGEACDDGDTDNGDGCSSTCTIESGYSCDPTTVGTGPSICTLSAPELTYGASDLSQAVYAGESEAFDLSGQIGSAVSGLAFNNDGTKMFVTHYDVPVVTPPFERQVFEYHLSTPFDVSTATFSGNSVNAVITPPDVEFNGDGTKMFVSDNSFGTVGTIKEYSLSTAFDVSTATYSTGEDYDTLGTDGFVPLGMTFFNNGTMFLLRDVGNLREYSLGTAYDISTASYTGKSAAYPDGNFGGVDFNNDGTKLYISGSSNDNLYEYSVSTPYDISTMTLDVTRDVSSLGNFAPTDLALSNDGSRLLVARQLSGPNFPAVTEFHLCQWFTEAAADDGSITAGQSGTINITDDTFTNAGGTLTHGVDYTITNLPAGLTPTLTVDGSGTFATLTFSGNASPHFDQNDVANLLFDFANSAFTGGNAAAVQNATGPAMSCFQIDFVGSVSPGGVDSNLQLWLKADAGVTESGGNVSQWADEANNPLGIVAVPSVNNPTYNSSGFNFNPGVYFDGDDVMRFNETSTPSNDISVLPVGNPHASVYAVFLKSDVTARAVLGQSLPGSGANDFKIEIRGNGPRLDLNNPNIAGTDPTVVGKPYIASAIDEGNGPDIIYFNVDGAQVGSYSGTRTHPADPTELGDAGSHSDNTDPLNGGIAEVIVYNDTNHSLIERQKVETYLALKYGITLSNDNNGNGTVNESVGSNGEGDYIASDGTTKMWDATANAAYSNDIAGIGRDDASGLNQKQSKSVNNDALVAIGLGSIAADNASNSNNFSTDKSFMVWGNNNAAATLSASYNGGSNNRLARVWKVQETGTVGNVLVQIPTSTAAGLQRIIIHSSDPAFGTVDREVALTTNGANYEATVDFADGDFFTFAQTAPTSGISCSSSELGFGDFPFTTPSGVSIDLNFSSTSNGTTTESSTCDATTISSGHFLENTDDADGGFTFSSPVPADSKILMSIKPVSFDFQTSFGIQGGATGASSVSILSDSSCNCLLVGGSGGYSVGPQSAGHICVYEITLSAGATFLSFGDSGDEGSHVSFCPAGSFVCAAGSNAPPLSATSASNACPATTVDLDALHTGSTPVGASLVWSTDGDASDGLSSTEASPTSNAGTYYAYYHDSANSCYSPASAPVTVSISACTAPGGVNSNLALWLKADKDATAATWLDQSGFGRVMNGGSSTAAPVANAINFNPAYIFDVWNDQLVGAGFDLEPDLYPDLTIYSVHKPSQDVDAGAVWGMDNGPTGGGARFLTKFSFGGQGNGVISIAGGFSPPGSSVEVPELYPVNLPMIAGVAFDQGVSNGSAAYKDGLFLRNFTANNATSGGNPLSIGIDGDSDIFHGAISELLAYGRLLSALERQQVESYLALKYGITLDQTTTQDYLASDGTTKAWDATANAAYSNDIAGIGRDDNSALNQKQSKSVNLDGIVAMGLTSIETSNSANTATFAADKNFLIWGNNNGNAAWTATGAPSGYEILERQWHVQETGTVGGVKMQFDVGDADFDVPALGGGTVYYLVYDSNNNDDLSDETPIALTNNGGDLWETSTALDFADGMEFTLATEISAPFITTWKTDNTGTSATNQIIIPMNTTYSYNFTIDWGDGCSDTVAGSDITQLTHTFDGTCTTTVNGTGTVTPISGTSTSSGIGTYAVEISGGFPHFRSPSGGDEEKILSVDQWGDIAWSSMGAAFSGATNLQVLATDAPDLSSATSLEGMFSGATTVNADFSGWDVSTITNMERIFSGASAFNGDVTTWNTSNVTSFTSMFDSASVFNQDIGNWNTSSATSLTFMFDDALAFNQDISTKTGVGIGGGDAWDVSNVTNMYGVFRDTGAFNQDIGNWKTSSATTMRGMFGGAAAFNQDIGNWNTSNVTTMQGMFVGSVFNQDISTKVGAGVGGGDAWNVSNVTTIRSMFHNNAVFNQDIGSWNTASVTDMQETFWQATAFNQDISGWDTSAVTNMVRTFRQASAFDQDLGTWTMTAVTDATQMLDNSALSVANYDATLIGWDAQTLQSGVTLGAAGLNYCLAESERANIIASDSWTITGDGKDCGTDTDSDSIPDSTDLDDDNDGILDIEEGQFGPNQILNGDFLSMGSNWSEDTPRPPGPTLFQTANSSAAAGPYALSGETNGAGIYLDLAGVNGDLVPAGLGTLGGVSLQNSANLTITNGEEYSMAFDVGETGGPNGNGDHTPESLQISWVLINPSTNTIAQVIPGTTMETEDPDKMGGLPIIPAVIESGTTRDLLTVASTFKATVPTGVYQLGMTWGLYNENIHSGSDIILDRIYFGQPLDTDSDGIPNHLDLDADNDGINDVIEGGGTDTDGDGQADGTVNGQGIPTSAGSGLTPPNSDTDSQPDYLDLDSDNDTISDLIEGGSGGTDANDDGMVDGPDADGDGIQNSVDGLPTFGDANSPALPDKDSGSDNDSAPDYTDLDDDVTGGAQDIDGTTNSALDTDNDGDVDSTDTGSQGDADGDGVDNAVDTDDANFGGIADASLSAVSLPVKLFLQGAYETTTDTMCDDLRTLTGANGFPQTSPYGGSETTTGAVLGNSDPNNAIVDWVNIELRDGGNNSSVVATVAALVQRDGDVVDASDGTSTLSLSGVTPGNYYLAVHHRNHLAAMTNSTVAVSGSTGTVDFTTMTDTQTHGSNAQVLLETGVYGLWGGNVNDNDTILRTGAGNDLDPLINTVLDDAGNVNDNTNYIVSGYYAGDLNMDGRVIAAGPNNDVTRVLSNIINHPANSGGNANHIVQEQLP